MSTRVEVYANTLANLERYLTGEGIETTQAQQSVQLVSQFHKEDLAGIYDQPPDVVLASKPRRFLVGGIKPFVLIQIVRPNIHEYHGVQVDLRVSERLSQPLQGVVQFGIEYNLTKPFPVRTFISRVSRIELNPLGILRGNLL